MRAPRRLLITAAVAALALPGAAATAPVAAAPSVGAVAHAYPQTAPNAGQFCKSIHVGVVTRAKNGRRVKCRSDGRYNRWKYT